MKHSQALIGISAVVLILCMWASTAHAQYSAPSTANSPNETSVMSIDGTKEIFKKEADMLSHKVPLYGVRKKRGGEVIIYPVMDKIALLNNSSPTLICTYKGIAYNITINDNNTISYKKFCTECLGSGKASQYIDGGEVSQPTSYNVTTKDSRGNSQTSRITYSNTRTVKPSTVVVKCAACNGSGGLEKGKFYWDGTGYILKAS